MKRLLLHSLAFPPDSNSTAHIMSDLAVELRSLGYSVTVVTTTPHNNLDASALERQRLHPRWRGLVYYSEYSGIPVWHVKVPAKGDRLWSRLPDFVRFHVLALFIAACFLERHDVVIATSPPPTIGIVSWLIARRWRVPSVYKVAEVYPDIIMEQRRIKNPVVIGALRRLERFVYARNSAIVAIGDRFRRLVLERGVPEWKARTIPDFVDTELYRPTERANSFAVANDLIEQFVVLYAGNIGLLQDWEIVLGAAALLTEEPVLFVIIGDGARRPWLENEVRARTLTNVRILGYQPRELMPQINASCDLAMIPMTAAGSRDGMPSKVYSMMASGKSVLASADPSSDLAHVIASAGCGTLVAPGDVVAFASAVRAAAGDRVELAAAGGRGRARVERDYSKQAVARLYDRLIRDLTGDY